MITAEPLRATAAARPVFIASTDDEAEAIARGVREARSSFYWAMRLLPAARRKAVYALYALCRELDDVADGQVSPSLKLALLSEWRSEIGLLFTGQPSHMLTRALLEPVREYRLRCDDFLDFIEGMEMDARTDIRAPSVTELDLYCKRVSGAVGLIAARIFGLEGPQAEHIAAELGRAMQLTNILRDLVEDAGRYRLYLPREVLRVHGILATMPSSVLAHPAFPHVCRDVAMIAEEHYAAAATAIAAWPWWRARPIAAMLGIYRTLLHELMRRGWRRLDEKVSLPGWRKAALVLRCGFAGTCEGA